MHTAVSSQVSRREMLRLFGLMGAASLVAPAVTTAASTAPSLPKLGHYAFKIGALDAWAFIDGGFAPALDESPFAVGEPRPKVAAVLHDHLLATDRVNLTFGVLLVHLGSEWVLVDTGCGGLFGPAGGRLLAHLAAVGIAPSTITAVFITHLHGDHMGGLLDANGQPVFPNAKVFLHRTEHAAWSQSSLPGVDAGTLATAQRFIKAFEGKWQLVKGGDKLIDGLELIDAPGHTPGHTVLTFNSGNEQLLHWVDIAHHHVISVERPDWVIGWDVDPAMGIATRKKFLDRAATDRARIFGAHMPFPCLGRVRRKGDGFEYLIEPWITA